MTTNTPNKASKTQPRTTNHIFAPKRGDRYQCSKCGMSIEVTSDCRCDKSEEVHFQCCGQELQNI